MITSVKALKVPMKVAVRGIGVFNAFMSQTDKYGSRVVILCGESLDSPRVTMIVPEDVEMEILPDEFVVTA